MNDIDITNYSLKEIRKLEKKIFEILPVKINEHFFNIFSLHSTEDQKRYLTTCKFENTYSYSKILYILDPYGRYAVEYDRITFYSFEDITNEWRLQGEPNDYELIKNPPVFGKNQIRTDLKKLNVLSLCEESKDSNIFLERMTPLSIFLWNKYRLYIHTKPNDDIILNYEVKDKVTVDQALDIAGSVSLLFKNEPYLALKSERNNETKSETFYEKIKNKIYGINIS